MAPAGLDQTALDYWQAHIDQLLTTDQTLPRAFVRDTPGRRILELRAAGKGMLFHASGTWDASRERLWLANSLVMARYLDEQIAALLWHFEHSDTITIKGEAAIWADIARVIGMARAAHPEITPRLYGTRPEKVTKPPRGRAGKHSDLVEKVYALLQEYRAGAQAVVKIGILAAAIHCDRRTISEILKELRGDEEKDIPARITTRRLAGGAGLLVKFPPKRDVIYSTEQAAELPTVAPETAPATAALGDTEKRGCVSTNGAAGDHISEPPTLAELAAYYLDQPAPTIGERSVSTKTGQIAYRRTAKHFAALVMAEYPYTAEEAITAYRAEQERRKALAAEEWKRFFARLDTMTNDELITYVGGRCRTEVHELARDGSVFDKHLYATRLKCAKRQMQRRGLKMPKRAAHIRAV